MTLPPDIPRAGATGRGERRIAAPDGPLTLPGEIPDACHWTPERWAGRSAARRRPTTPPQHSSAKWCACLPAWTTSHHPRPCARCGMRHRPGYAAPGRALPGCAVTGVEAPCRWSALRRRPAPPSRWTRTLRALGWAARGRPRAMPAPMSRRSRRPQAVDLSGNLALQWVGDVPHALAELHRVLAVAACCSSPRSVRTRCANCAPRSRWTPACQPFADMHDLGDMLLHAGFADPVMDIEYLTLTYATPAPHWQELKALGATNATVGRPRGMMGRAALARLEAGLARPRATERNRDVRGGTWPRVEGGHATPPTATRSWRFRERP